MGRSVIIVSHKKGHLVSNTIQHLNIYSELGNSVNIKKLGTDFSTIPNAGFCVNFTYFKAEWFQSQNLKRIRVMADPRHNSEVV